ncbi:lipid A export permease/ATP-binding protein MsbA [Endozoicomonadaceae bacterium StTr2]
MSKESPAAEQGGFEAYIRLLGYVRPFWKLFALSLLGYLIFAASQPMFPAIIKYFVEYLEGGEAQLVYLVPLGVIGIGLFRGLGSFLGSYYIAKVSMSVVHSLRTALFDRLIRLPNSYFDNNNSGHLISRITYNVGMVTGAATDAIKVLVREGLSVIALMGYLLWTNWQLSLVFIATLPFIALVVTTASKRFRKLSKKIQTTMGDVTHISSETINGYQVVRGFGGEKYERERFHTASERNTNQNVKLVKVSATHTPMLQLIVLTAVAGLIFLILYLRSTGYIQGSTGDLVSFLTAAGLLPKPIRQLSEVNSTIQRGIAAAESIFEQIDEPIEEDNGTLELDRAKGQLEFKNLTFSYNNAATPALQDINFTIKPGQTVALVGRSGSGKTTLANLIPRFYQHSDGQILLDGTPIQDYTLPNLRRQIALVSQNVSLFNDTVTRNIAYGDLSSRTPEEIRAAADAAYATQFVEKLPEGMETLIGEDGVLLSGGQRQRLAIARAILKDAPLLILDEATSALDTESERYIQAALDEVMKNRTTLVIAHRLSTIENADVILVMDQGRIIEQGSHEELLAKGNHYATLHRMQFREENYSGDNHLTS